MDYNVTTVAAVAVTGLITSLTNIVRDRQRRKGEERNRQWDIDDRERKAKETQEALTSQAKQVAEHAQAQTDQVLGAIADNTEVSKNAFSAANDVNTKFLKLHARIDAMAQAVAGNMGCAQCQNFIKRI